MGRPPVKSTYRVEKAKTRAHIQAEYEMQKKKPINVSVKEHIGKLIDSIKIDPLEVAAVLGMTFIVKEVIDGSEELIIKARAKGSWLQKNVGTAGTWFAAFTAGPLLLYLTTPSDEDTPEIKALKEAFNSPTTEMMEWMAAFALSYIIVHNAGQLLGLLEGGITKIVPMLLG